MNMKKAALINAAGKYSKVFMSIIVNAILARILSAEDYGILAVITVFSTFFTTLSDMGFGPAIIQKKDLTDDDIGDIFSLTVYISLGLMFLFALLSYPISVFYGNKVYILLGVLLSISLLFNALNMVPNGILNRNKKFVSIAVRTVIVYICHGNNHNSGIPWVQILCFGNSSNLSAFLTFVWNYLTTRPV